MKIISVYRNALGVSDITRYVLIFLVSLLCLFHVGAVQSQTHTLTMADALEIVRAELGQDVVFISGEYNDNSQCWQIELEEATICVSDTTGTILEPSEPQPDQTGDVIAIGLFVFALATFIGVQRLNQGHDPSVVHTTSQLDIVLPVNINRLPYVLGFIAGFLALQSVAARWIQDSWAASPDWFDVVVRIININLEQSLPTWFATILLIIAALLAYVVASYKRSASYRKHWFGLSLIFVYLSIDEAISLHEELTIPLREALDATGIFYFAWIIVGGVLVALVGLIYLRFLFNQPAQVRNLFILAGVLFVGGAVGIESISAALYEQTGTTAVYSTIGTVEELFEMLGVIVLIRALLISARLAGNKSQTEFNEIT